MNTGSGRGFFMIRRYVDGANIVTGLNVVIGVLALQAALSKKFDVCVALVFVATLLDHLDGWLARRFFSEHAARRAFGLQFDTLADLLNFDVVPALLLMALAPGALSTGVGAALVLFGSVRLAHFNISTAGGGRHYLGLPTTFAGFIVVNLVLLQLAGAFGILSLMGLALVVALLQVACIPLRLPGVAACVTGLTVVYAANVAVCRFAFAH